MSPWSAPRRPEFTITAVRRRRHSCPAEMLARLPAPLDGCWRITIYLHIFARMGGVSQNVTLSIANVRYFGRSFVMCSDFNWRIACQQASSFA
jgi:hypothetical protein